MEDGRVLYDLCAVIVHEGRAMSQGHYTCYCRAEAAAGVAAAAAGVAAAAADSAAAAAAAAVAGGAAAADGAAAAAAPAAAQWLLFNDDKVCAVAEHEVLAQQAYLLFYQVRARPPAPPSLALSLSLSLSRSLALLLSRSHALSLSRSLALSLYLFLSARQPPYPALSTAPAAPAAPAACVRGCVNDGVTAKRFARLIFCGRGRASRA